MISLKRRRKRKKKKLSQERKVHKKQSDTDAVARETDDGFVSSHDKHDTKVKAQKFLRCLHPHTSKSNFNI